MSIAVPARSELVEAKNQRDRIEFLEEQVTILREQLGFSVDDWFVARCREVFGLTKGKAQLLKVLLTARSASRETLHMALYSDQLDPPDMPVIGTLICQLRPLLRRHGVEIETIWGTGYSLSPDMKAKIEALLS